MHSVRSAPHQSGGHPDLGAAARAPRREKAGAGLLCIRSEIRAFRRRPVWSSLEGLQDILAPKPLEVLPYTSGRLRRRPDVAPIAAAAFANPFLKRNDATLSVGADVKYRLTSNFTLDATINPDFGQVELRRVADERAGVQGELLAQPVAPCPRALLHPARAPDRRDTWLAQIPCTPAATRHAEVQLAA